MLTNVPHLSPVPQFLSIIDRFTNIQIYGWFFPQDLVKSYSINLLIINALQYLESGLHTLAIAMSGIPRASFEVVKNNLCF